jgi:hypothetical protein
MLMFCADFARGCFSHASGRLEVPPATDFTLAECSRRESAYLNSPVGRRNLADWMSKLAEIPLPVSPLRAIGELRSISGALGADALSRMSAIARDNQGTRMMVMLAWFAKLLGEILNRPVAIRSIVSQRGSIRGAYRLLNCMLDQFVYLLPLSNFSTIDSLVRQVFSQSVENMERHIPYWMLVGQLDHSLYLSPFGVIENEFNYLSRVQNQNKLVTSDSTMGWLPIRMPAFWATFRRGLLVVEREKDCFVQLTYDAGTVSDEEANLLLSKLCSVG